VSRRRLLVRLYDGGNRGFVFGMEYEIPLHGVKGL